MGDNLSDYPKYSFQKTFTKLNAFNTYIKNANFSPYFAWTSTEGTLDIYTTRELTEEEQNNLTQIIDNYVDPEVWLEFSHAENACLSTNSTNSATPTVLQTLIVSPYADNNNGSVMDSMKTVIEYSTPAVEMFSNWNSNECPIELSLDIYNYTQGSYVVQTPKCVNCVAEHFQGLANSNITGPGKLFKTVQIYGLRNLSPGSDCIWQFHASITNSNIYISMNSLQKLFYTVQ